MKILLCLMLLATLSGQAAEITKDFFNFARAINTVEAGGKLTRVKSGDGGRALGPLQIHKSYWKDAISHDPNLGGSYKDCKDWSYSVKVMWTFLDRHAPDALKKRDWETLARIHNGGPDGHEQKSTLDYWLKVKGAM